VRAVSLQKGRARTAAAACLGLAPLLWQAPPTEPTPTFSARVSTVRVDVLVTDGEGPLLGLQAKDFEVRDDGVLQQVEIATPREIPLNVVLALDRSGSVSGERLVALRNASLAVVKALGPNDKAAVLSFSDSLSLEAGLTSDATRVRAALDQRVASAGTSLVDACYSAMVLSESDTGRALVIAMSDGSDTASFLTPESVLETAKRSETVVYGVSVGQGGGGFLGALATQTGGRVLKGGSNGDLGGAFLAILEEFRHRYLLGYVPSGVPLEGWHRLEVRVRNRRAVVQARPGYVAGP